MPSLTPSVVKIVPNSLNICTHIASTRPCCASSSHASALTWHAVAPTAPSGKLHVSARRLPSAGYRGSTGVFTTRRMNRYAGSRKTEATRALKVQESDAEAPEAGLAVRDKDPPPPPPGTDSRLWSNLNKDTLKHEPGSLLGAIALVGGTTVGAGILALPAVAQPAGFAASSLAILACWAYMATTGLLLAEVNLATMCELGSGGVSLNSMAERTLGKRGQFVAGAAYILLHYALLVAYIARAGELTAGALGVPTVAGLALFGCGLGGLVYALSPRQVDAVNGVLAGGVVAVFGGLVALAGSNVQLANLEGAAHWEAVPGSIPVIALSFVHHNVIPVVSTSLEGNYPKIRKAVLIGTAIPLAMFLLWDAVILGQLPPDAAAGYDPLAVLRESEAYVGPAIAAFSFLAISTSFIGFVLGLTDFVADYLKIPLNEKSVVPYTVTLVPPLLFASTYPDVFFNALEVAGVFGVLVLFGVFPAAMSWKGRYGAGENVVRVEPLVPGGRLMLGGVMGFAGCVIAGDVVSRLQSAFGS